MVTERVGGELRAMCVASWVAAQRREAQGSLPMTPASAAGWLLEICRDPYVARAHVPAGTWGDRVREILDQIAVAEGAAFAGSLRSAAS